MKDRLPYIRSLLSATYQEWSQHDAQTQGAALSYFTVLSLAPLLMIAVSIAGLAFGKQVVQAQIVQQMKALVGAGADAIQTMLTHAQSPKAGVIATIVGFVVLLFGASGVFTQLRKALNRIWDVQPSATAGWFGILRQQFFSFTMVVGIGFLLLVSLLVTTFVAGLGKFAGNYLPAGLLQVGNVLVALVVITCVFALVYRFVPEQTLPWRRLWPGSLATAILFEVGKYLLGLYLGRASVTSAYGAAGSLVVLLIWVYYSSQLFLFGAEFTRIYACRSAGVCLNVPNRARQPDHEEQGIEVTASRSTSDKASNLPPIDRAEIRSDASARTQTSNRVPPRSTESGSSLKQLIQQALSTIQEILRSEVRLAKVEIKETGKKAAKSGAVLGGGVALGLYALGLLLLAAAFALWLLVPLWLAFLLLSAAVGVVATGLILTGRRRILQVQPVPEKTVATVKENLEWPKRRAS